MTPYKIHDPLLSALLAVMNFDDHLVLTADQAKEYGIENADILPLEEEDDYGQ